MSDELAITVIGGLSALIALGGAAVRQVRRNRVVVALDPVWGQWAAQRGFSFEPSRPIGTALTAPRVVGVVDQTQVTLDGMILDPDELVAPSASSRERRRMPHTSVAARAYGVSPGAMVVVSKSRVDHVEPPAGYRQMDLADARFDEACALWSAPGSPARWLDDRRVRAALVRLAERPFVLVAQGGSLWIRWPGYETNPEMLDHAVTALVGLARGSLSTY